MSLSNDHLADDVLDFTSVSRFAGNNVGDAKTIAVTDIAATAADAGNYVWNSSTSALANVTEASAGAPLSSNSEETGSEDGSDSNSNRRIKSAK